MSLTIRLRSREGNSRIQVDPSTSGQDLAQKIVESLGDDVDVSSIRLSNQPGSAGDKLSLDSLLGRTVDNMGFKNGEMLFLDFQTGPSSSSKPKAPPKATPPPATLSSGPVEPSSSEAAPAFYVPPDKRVDPSTVEEEEVDVYYRTQSGMIPRERDSKMCRHGDKGMCDYCMPLEPYDATYHADQKIKHLSFPSYLRKLTGSISASKAATSSSAVPPLSPPDFRVASPCPSGSHAPWPQSICSKCQPSAITLQSQEYRLVDHVEFADPSIIDRFLEGWRRGGKQRFGFLIGRYMPYETVPMGVKAVVEAVEEPEQEGEIDGVSVDMPWKDEERVKRLARWCANGLQVVGMVYTDLTPNPDDITQTLYKRHAQSHYLSSLELLFSAQLQLAHPNPSKSSPTGVFGSRFVTCVLTGTKDGAVDVMAFQASEQAVAMVRADMIEASVDPSTVRVKKEEKSRYIPDVFYTFKNAYNLQVKQSAKPCFPVEYLLVNLTHGFPNTPSPLFTSSKKSSPFPIENRQLLQGDPQNTGKVVSSLVPIVGNGVYDEEGEGEMRRKVEEWASDWHLLGYLDREGVLGEDEMALLARVATARAKPEGDADALTELARTPGWLQLMDIVKQTAQAMPKPSSSSRPARDPSIHAELYDQMDIADDDFPDIPPEEDDFGGASTGGGGGGGGMACPHCTFFNERDHGDCEICGLPLAG